MKKAIWPPPTRRAFVTMLGFGVAALAVVKAAKAAPEGEAPTPPTLWIGHC